MRVRWFRWAAGLLCLLALMTGLGAPWWVLQSIAWGRMLAVYSQSDSLPQAVIKTFDGQHPCSWCVAIRAGRQEQRNQQPDTPTTKPDFRTDLFCESGLDPVLLPPTDCWDAAGFVPRAPSEFKLSPPKPPPRPLDRAVRCGDRQLG
jgi:hypothetical protein